MNRQFLVNGLLSITAVSMMTGCVDDKYDLTDIDTTSRFTVDNLTVPINLSEIKLDNVINLSDNENIEKLVDGNGNEYYAIVKGGAIAPTAFNLGSIHVNSPELKQSNFHVSLPGNVNVPGVEIDLDPIALPESPLQNYSFDMNNVNVALKQLKNVKTASPIRLEVVLSVPQELAGGSNRISFRDLKIQLPWGLMTDMDGYDVNTGLLSISELPVDGSGKARLVMDASGLDLDDKGVVADGHLGISGQVGIVDGYIKMTLKDLALSGGIDIKADYSISAFDIASFSGDIDYNMDAIHIDPISLSDLPDFLDSPETNLIIADPQILVSIKNPVGNRNLEGKGRITLTSDFNTGTRVPYSSDVFSLVGEESRLAFCTGKAGYTYVAFDGLRNVLSNGDSGLPSKVEVDIDDINFKGYVEDFPLGNLGNAEGEYEFNAPLGFGNGSVVVYETTEGDWGSEDLDDVHIRKIHLTAKCTTDLPVGLQLSVVPVDKEGNAIPVKEDSAKFSVPAHCVDSDVALDIEALDGTTISGFDGVRFRAVVKQDSGNTEPLGPNLNITLSDLRVTVDGYFEKEL